MSTFYFIAFLSIFFSILVITARNPVHSILYLILTFFTFTIHYILMNAQFLAIVNFIVYMGAILVLFLYTLMLINLNKESEPRKSNLVKIAGFIGGACFLITIVAALKAFKMSDSVVTQNNDLGLVKNLGKILFNEFLLPFEISSVLLLSAMVGAVLLATKDPKAA
ncbi:MAG: NADH-quinone oxidoreductase subunit J family protein [Mucilaginibacter sp.]|uniref:NADH-quinone oxidoreductase subunit J family protein n=1 Tax=Mucilaginibacter sp. L3T2-6 TaxID=3062491 RepID=UPI002674F543|nr:NADH-quinone oxidoreductase subunit J [Mucilaginibacter sp. L3T2-6]MDO3640736.1 NADH-quinone oxidoreductase subunit J [Mucilaginibacter sp. L3T2-6]MDV6212923.1 NADH-quinone oxidoreductase subunit J [Mucilaginibacter sp. L3T2-6]